MKFTCYCSCGGAMKGEIRPDSKALEALAIWDTIHRGEGHKPVDAAKASRARRKSERLMEASK
jgi:hypothetical protein